MRQPPEVRLPPLLPEFLGLVCLHKQVVASLNQQNIFFGIIGCSTSNSSASCPTLRALPFVFPMLCAPASKGRVRRVSRDNFGAPRASREQSHSVLNRAWPPTLQAIRRVKSQIMQPKDNSGLAASQLEREFQRPLAQMLQPPQMVECFNTADAALKMVRCDQCCGIKSSAVNRRNHPWKTILVIQKIATAMQQNNGREFLPIFCAAIKASVNGVVFC